MQDLISIIVPIYRVEKYLPTCIESLISQTYQNIEIILVDDGSDDKCGSICDEYARIDSRIQVIHKKNEGLDKARKSGFLKAKGKYIGYVDGDDWVESTMYQQMISKAQEYSASVVECGVIDSWCDHEKKRPPYLKEGYYSGSDFISEVEPILLYTGSFFETAVYPYVWNKLFLKEDVREFQLAEGDVQELLNDNLVTYPTLLKTKSLFVEPQCLVHYRVNNNSIKHTVNSKRDKLFSDIYRGYVSRIRLIASVSNMKQQIYYMCMYQMLGRVPYVFDREGDTHYLRPFGYIPVNSKIVLYGAGEVGIHLHHYIEQRNEEAIVCWVDKNHATFCKEYGVSAPNEILNCQYDFVIISIMRKSAVDEVFEELKMMGISENKILWLAEEYIYSPQELLRTAVMDGEKIVDDNMDDVEWHTKGV